MTNQEICTNCKSSLVLVDGNTLMCQNKACHRSSLRYEVIVVALPVPSLFGTSSKRVTEYIYLLEPRLMFKAIRFSAEGNWETPEQYREREPVKISKVAKYMLTEHFPRQDALEFIEEYEDVEKYFTSIRAAIVSRISHPYDPSEFASTASFIRTIAHVYPKLSTKEVLDRVSKTLDKSVVETKRVLVTGKPELTYEPLEENQTSSLKEAFISRVRISSKPLPIALSEAYDWLMKELGR